MGKRKKALYDLAIYLAPWLPRRELDDVVGDYEEYLRDRPPQLPGESPREFGRALRQHRLRRTPVARAVAACLAALVLAGAALVFDRGGNAAQKVLSLAALAAGLPLAMWAALGGLSVTTYSPVGRAPRAMTMTAMATLLAALMGLRYWQQLLAGAAQGTLTPMAGAAAGMVVAAAQLLCCAVWLLAVWRTAQRSIFYLCLQAQAVALWTFFRCVSNVMHGMAPGGHPMPSLLPFALGWCTSAVLWVVLRRLTREAD